MAIYLIELRPVDPATGQIRSLLYGSHGYTTEPYDTPSNAWFEDRIVDPGNYERSLFSKGRTRGDNSVGGGDIILNNADGGLDFILIDKLAFDGRIFTIWSLEDVNSRWSDRQVVLEGVMEQAEYPSRRVSIRIRDRLALLRKTIQTESFLGTTINGGMTVAEGNVDLKDVKRPLLYGNAPFNITPVTTDQFDDIYEIASNGLSAITVVRDSGVKLTPTQDYPTLAALKAATLVGSQYATCLVKGILRTAVRPDGALTVDAIEGATVADRSAARIVRRILGDKVPVNEEDFDRLHQANPAECGIWIDTDEKTILSVVTSILGSIGAYIAPDRFGVMRVGRLEVPSSGGSLPTVVLDRHNILDSGDALSRTATNDEGSSVPIRSVTVRYAPNYTTFSDQDLKDVNATDEFRSFAKEEWRKEERKSAANEQLYPEGPQPIFNTYLTFKADAEAEADRLLAFYEPRRDLFIIQVASTEVVGVDLNDLALIQISRFGMGDGRLFRVLSITATLVTNITEIEAWG